ncbi:MAG: arylsulfotransferase family protein [Gaiellaceae bacterium]
MTSAGALATLARARVAGASRDDGGSDATTSRFQSRPDLTPPLLSVDHRSPGGANGYVLVAPFTGQDHGTALIADDSGEPVWIYQSPKLVMNFRSQTLFGKPVLTWWEGAVVDGFFAGECVVADESYGVVKRLSAGNGLQPEVHEFLITARNTALISFNNLVPADLSPYGGPSSGTVIEGVVQEIEIATGKVLFEWHSLDHVGLDETSFPASGKWDYFHLNSIEVDEDDNLLVSGRYPSTIYKVDRQSGEVIWRLGGTKSDFRFEPAATFWFQHDARARGGGLVSLFDDGADAVNNAPEAVSRAIVLSLDVTAKTAALVQSFPNPNGSLTVAMGSAQHVHTGGYFVGWGTVPQVSEFGADGSLVFNATFPGGQSSYRAFRAQWDGRAAGRPAVAARHSANGSLDVYASWNGASRVSHWQVVGGEVATELERLNVVPRAGFETRIRLAHRPRHVAAVALGATGEVLGTSPVIST